MTSTLLDITDKVDPDTQAILRAVAKAARSLGIPFFVIGATARDLVLHHHYGVPVSRATLDRDFAVQIPDWSTFEALKDKLLDSGFSETKMTHRFTADTGGWIDLIPFGPISDEGNTIAWPPTGEVVMNILGFSEACEHALQVRISDSPELILPVVSPPGLALLKLVSWTERERDKSSNDAKDLLYLCATYYRIPEVEGCMYAQNELMESYGWVPERGSANRLGRDVRQIVGSDTHEFLERLFNGSIKSRSLRDLARESCDVGVGEEKFDEHASMIQALVEGYHDES